VSSTIGVSGSIFFNIGAASIPFKRGINIDYLSLFNEPEKVYTKIKYPEIRVLLRDFMSPAVQQSGLTTKIMLSEAPERLNA
jgi:O-glycosyl hydrolase